MTIIVTERNIRRVNEQCIEENIAAVQSEAAHDSNNAVNQLRCAAHNAPKFNERFVIWGSHSGSHKLMQAPSGNQGVKINGLRACRQRLLQELLEASLPNYSPTMAEWSGSVVFDQQPFKQTFLSDVGRLFLRGLGQLKQHESEI